MPGCEDGHFRLAKFEDSVGPLGKKSPRCHCRTGEAQAGADGAEEAPPAKEEEPAHDDELR